ncbi:hypothetical protein ACFO3O_17990 [Dokdonia ponticola]|uniref:Gliding motility-associated protein GldM C-terminal domain-containing protein n=1 Tax=Dokdonia ponticola TaxID=2041041 RepID=A0ABV9I053_9FLAO
MMHPKKIALVLLFVCFAVSSSFAQNSKKKAVDPTMKVSKEKLAQFNMNENGDTNTTSFKIKFPGYPTISVKGNRLNNEALERLESTEAGTRIQVFDIKDASSKKEGAKKNPPLLFKVTSTP